MYLCVIAFYDLPLDRGNYAFHSLIEQTKIRN
jgi:hypothetical protein